MAVFKLKKADTYARLVGFPNQPIWEELASRIGVIYRIPPERVEIAFQRDGEMIAINDNEALQHFYEFSYQPPESAKFVVQDIEVPDS
jgi:hypothetical protein